MPRPPALPETRRARRRDRRPASARLTTLSRAKPGELRSWVHIKYSQTRINIYGDSQKSRTLEHHSGTPAPLSGRCTSGRWQVGQMNHRCPPPAESREGKCLTWCLLVSQEPNREEALLQQLKEKDELILRLQSELVSAALVFVTRHRKTK